MIEILFYVIFLCAAASLAAVIYHYVKFYAIWQHDVGLVRTIIFTPVALFSRNLSKEARAQRRKATISFAIFVFLWILCITTLMVMHNVNPVDIWFGIKRNR
jgi:hypothetical protein